MKNSEPQLSVVVVSRNDDHGGNLLERMQLFVTGWLEQAKRHGLSSELVIVEWNPLPDRPGLGQVLEWPKGDGPCSVRIIEVPPELHSLTARLDRLQSRLDEILHGYRDFVIRARCKGDQA